MFITIIMMNFKNIFFTTGISVLFGVYSIYNILEYLRVLNNHRVKQINSLQHLQNDTKKKYNDLQLKFNQLQKNHDELTINYEKINKEIHQLHIKINELQEKKTIDIDFTSLQDANNISNEISNNTIYNHNIICDELCDLNSSIPRIHMETMNSINDDIDEEFVESLSLDYDYSDTGDVSSLGNSEKGSIKSRSRSSSVTEINWTNLTKKFIFG